MRGRASSAGRRRWGRLRVAAFAFEFGDVSTRREHGQRDGLRAERVKLVCQYVVKLPTQRRVDDRPEFFRRPWLHAL